MHPRKGMMLVSALALCCGTSVAAQTITVRVLNGKNGRPIAGQKVTITASQIEKPKAGEWDNLRAKTGNDGAVSITVPPHSVGLGISVQLDAARWNGSCGAAIKTVALLSSGLLLGITPGGKQAKIEGREPKPLPGEALCVTTPLSFWERLLYPFVKG